MAVAGALAGAQKLRKQIQMASRQHGNSSGRGAALAPLLSATARIQSPEGLMRDIVAWVDDEGNVQEQASEQVRQGEGEGVEGGEERGRECREKGEHSFCLLFPGQLNPCYTTVPSKAKQLSALWS